MGARMTDYPNAPAPHGALFDNVPTVPAPPVPDWPKAPKWCCWWAVNEDGSSTWFGPKPSLGSRWWYVRENPTHCNVTSHAAGHVDLNGCDWEKTLRCKPGFVP